MMIIDVEKKQQRLVGKPPPYQTDQIDQDVQASFVSISFAKSLSIFPSFGIHHGHIIIM
jgi:hypothetical protein